MIQHRAQPRQPPGPSQLHLGPLALTRAMCPPGSRPDRIVRHWSFVRSSVIEDGRLFLSLMADGGVYEFAPLRDVLLGVARSGGGSRAALFGAAGLEALASVGMADGASVIDNISHLSSISGGSIAAAYYALKKPGRDVKVLNADGTLSDAYRAFFDRYLALAAKTLAELLRERLYGAARMRDLSARGPATARGSSSTPRSATTVAASH